MPHWHILIQRLSLVIYPEDYQVDIIWRD